MISIGFDGWFQCRLATDPDAYDERRGKSGWTFAMPGEPDLDRMIRFHRPVAPRSHGPQVGVFVRAVALNGAPSPGHLLVGGTMDLLGGAVFEGRNGEIATSASEPIVPFSLEVRKEDIRLLGRDPMDLTDPAEVIRRQPQDFDGNSAEVRAATGVSDPRAYRQSRKGLLEADLASPTDPTAGDALRRRIQELGLGSIRTTSLSFKLTYEFELRGPNQWTDPARVLGVPPASGSSWKVRFWVGGWDADALCGYVSGSLTVGD
jgi:hypothetical protein